MRSRVSTTAKARIDRWDRLEQFLIRLVRKCEICNERKGLSGHIVYNLARKETLEARAKNTLVVCPKCHDHKRYGTGIELTFEEAMGIIAARNVEKKIDSTIG